jgi:hypothetical protein
VKDRQCKLVPLNAKGVCTIYRERCFSAKNVEQINKNRKAEDRENEKMWNTF